MRTIEDLVSLVPSQPELLPELVEAVRTKARRDTLESVIAVLAQAESWAKTQTLSMVEPVNVNLYEAYAASTALLKEFFEKQR